MPSHRTIAAWGLLLGAGMNLFALAGAELRPKPVFLYASQAGRPTFDEDGQGGNPFATALVQLLSRNSMSFHAFKIDLVTLTRRASRGRQTADVVGAERLAHWQFLPRPRDQVSVALIVVFSDYSRSGAGASLPGAKRDSYRLADAFSRAGFVVTRLADPDERALAQALKDFERRAADADVAVIYTTGHGVETKGAARILLRYARADGSKALPLAELATAARAKRANLVFYAACRHDIP